MNPYIKQIESNNNLLYIKMQVQDLQIISTCIIVFATCVLAFSNLFMTNYKNNKDIDKFVLWSAGRINELEKENNELRVKLSKIKKPLSEFQEQIQKFNQEIEDIENIKNKEQVEEENEEEEEEEVDDVSEDSEDETDDGDDDDDDGDDDDEVTDDHKRESSDEESNKVPVGNTVSYRYKLRNTIRPNFTE